VRKAGNLRPSCPVVTKSGDLNFLEPSGPVQTCNGTVYLYLYLLSECGPGSSVGIATGYGQDGPGSNPGGDEIYRRSRPALGHLRPPVKWGQSLSRG